MRKRSATAKMHNKVHVGSGGPGEAVNQLSRRYLDIVVPQIGHRRLS